MVCSILKFGTSHNFPFSEKDHGLLVETSGDCPLKYFSYSQLAPLLIQNPGCNPACTYLIRYSEVLDSAASDKAFRHLPKSVAVLSMWVGALCCESVTT